MRHLPLALMLLFAAATAVLVGASAVLLRTDSISRVNSSPPPSRSVGLHVLVQELRGPMTLLWQAPAGSPDQRTVVSALSHRDGYGPRVMVSLDGRQAAATLLPPEGTAPDTAAVLVVIDLTTGEQRTIAKDVDLHARPVWRPDGGALAVRRWEGGVPQIAVIGVNGDDQGGVTWPEALYLTAAGWDARGRLLVAAMLSGGYDLVAPRTAEFVAHLGDGPARDFRLAPDGRRLAYLAEVQPDGATLQSVDLSEGQSTQPWKLLASNIYGAAWLPDSSGLALSAQRSGGPLRWQSLARSEADVYPALEGAAGLDIPVAAGPEGWLAVRRLAGPDPQQPLSESLWLLGPRSSRSLSAEGPLEFVGWRVLP